jgi:hypothetical protein
MPSANVLAQNDMQSVNFRLKGIDINAFKNPIYFAIIKVFVPTAAGIGTSAIVSCPA